MSSDDSVSYDTIEKGDHMTFAVLTLKPANSHHLITKKLISDLRKKIQLAVKDEVKGLITTHEGDWFSGGFDYQSAPPVEEFRKLIADFIQLPFPTVAYVSGSAKGAGFTLALVHDYLVLSNDKPVSLCHDELRNGHEVLPYSAALVTDKFQWLASLELLVWSSFVTPPHFAPISNYVSPYVGWTTDQVVDKLLKPLVISIVGKNYSMVREILLPLTCQQVKLIN